MVLKTVMATASPSTFLAEVPDAAEAYARASPRGSPDAVAIPDVTSTVPCCRGRRERARQASPATVVR